MDRVQQISYRYDPAAFLLVLIHVSFQFQRKRTTSVQGVLEMLQREVSLLSIWKELPNKLVSASFSWQTLLVIRYHTEVRYSLHLFFFKKKKICILEREGGNIYLVSGSQLYSFYFDGNQSDLNWTVFLCVDEIIFSHLYYLFQQ